MQSKLFILFIFIISLFIYENISAIDIRPAQPDTTKEIIVVDSIPVKFISFSQLALGFSHRIDNRQLINHSPTVLAKYYFHVSDRVVGKAGIGYSNSNKFKSAQWETIQFRDIKIEIGFRWKIINEYISFYHENGIEYNYYREPISGIWEQRIGMNISLGINFEVYQNLKLDIAIVQTLNNPDFDETKNISPSTSPIGLKNELFFNEVFNPLRIQFLIFRKL